MEFPAAKTQGRPAAKFEAARKVRDHGARLEFFKEVSDFLAGRFAVVDGEFRGFVGAFADCLGGSGRVVAHDLKGVLGAIGGFDDNGLSVFTDAGDSAVESLDAIFGDLIDFNAGLLGTLFGVVDYDFGALGDAMEGVFGAAGGGFGTMDGGLVHEMNGVLGAVFCFDDHSLGAGIQLGDGAMDGGDHVLGRADRQDQ